MSMNSESIQNFVLSYMGVLGLPYSKHMGPEQFLGGVHANEKMEAAYRVAYDIKYSDKYWQRPIQVMLARHNIVQPTHIITNDGKELGHLFGNGILANPHNIVRITSHQLELEKQLGEGKSVKIGTDIGTFGIRNETMQLGLDVRSDGAMAIKENFIFECARTLAEGGVACVSVAKSTRADRHEKITQGARDVIDIMTESGLTATHKTVLFLPDEIMVCGHKALQL